MFPSFQPDSEICGSEICAPDTGPSVLLQPVDRLLMRLDVAGLLRRTTPHATADADAIPEEVPE